MTSYNKLDNNVHRSKDWRNMHLTVAINFTDVLWSQRAVDINMTLSWAARNSTARCCSSFSLTTLWLQRMIINVALLFYPGLGMALTEHDQWRSFKWMDPQFNDSLWQPSRKCFEHIIVRPLASSSSFFQAWDWHCQKTSSGGVWVSVISRYKIIDESVLKVSKEVV